jgi:hypothetical protein
MAKIIHPDPDARAWCRRDETDREGGRNGSWREVSSQYPSQIAPPIDQENAQRGFRSGIFLILAAAAAIVLVVMLFLSEGAFEPWPS